ncbi:MAG TPA: hypothetical protein VKE74_32885 [Gemmataceae bacterium]|nr:hypothetical protein [Gemmataceae bacterium]
MGRTEHGRGWAFAALLVLLASLAIPLFAHGCHTGDHDDEPLFVPQEPQSGDRGQETRRSV